MHWYIDVLKKYAVFSGRASRKEYWMFILMNIIVSFFLGAVIGILIVAGIPKQYGEGIQNLYSLAVLIPTIALGFRRLHDIGKSGWWAGGGIIGALLIFLISFLVMDTVAFLIVVPVLFLCIFAYMITMLIFAVRDSQPGDNKYGPNPKGI